MPRCTECIRQLRLSRRTFYHFHLVYISEEEKLLILKLGFSRFLGSQVETRYTIYTTVYIVTAFFLHFFLMASPFLLLFVSFVLSSFLPFTAAEFKNKFNITDVIRKVLTENIIMLKLKMQRNS